MTVQGSRWRRYLIAPVRVAGERTNAWIVRHRAVVVVVLIGWFLTLFVLRALTKSFWHDEVYTALLAEFPIAKLWRASLDAVDLSPPLNTWLTHAVQALTGPGLIATRLPPMLGFVAAAGFLFLTVSRRTSGIVGVLSVFVLCVTPAWDYAVEARGYGVSLGLFALALYAWTEAAAGRRPALHWTLMAAALAAEAWTHYYAALAVLPIVVGEAVRQAASRRWQIAPWLALACAALAMLPLLPLIAVSSAHRSTFWAQTGRQTIAGTYGYLAKDLLTYTITIAAVALLGMGELLRRARTGRQTRRLSAHDLAACLACLAIPAAAFLLGQRTHVFTARYLLFATVGLAFGIALVVWWLTPDHGLAEWLLVLTLAWPLAVSTYRTVLHSPAYGSELDQRPILVDWLIRAREPLVVTGGVDYLGMWYSLPEEARPRALYVADPESQLRAEGSDTVDRGYLALARWTPLPAVPVQQFLPTHRHFWMYTMGGNWIERRLTAMGASIVERGRERAGTGILYEVSLPER